MEAPPGWLLSDILVARFAERRSCQSEAREQVKVADGRERGCVVDLEMRGGVCAFAWSESQRTAGGTTLKARTIAPPQGLWSPGHSQSFHLW